MKPARNCHGVTVHDVVIFQTDLYKRMGDIRDFADIVGLNEMEIK